LFLLNQFLWTGGAIGGEALLETIRKMRKEVHSVALRQHIMNEKLPKITEVFITPSEYKKSKHKETFLDLMEIFGFGRVRIDSKIEQIYWCAAPEERRAGLHVSLGRAAGKCQL
jgi:hypothetical protein